MFSFDLCGPKLNHPLQPMPATPQYESERERKRQREMHYCRPDGNIPHDQTNQSPWWDAGAPQPCSNTPFHSLSATNTWSPINGPLRTGASPQPHRFMADDFIITHPSPSSSSRRWSVMSYLITLSSTHQPQITPRRPVASPRANPRRLMCMCVCGDGAENVVEKQEGGTLFYVPGWISHHLSHIKGTAAGWYQMPSNC